MSASQQTKMVDAAQAEVSRRPNITTLAIDAKVVGHCYLHETQPGIVDKYRIFQSAKSTAKAILKKDSSC